MLYDRRPPRVAPADMPIGLLGRLHEPFTAAEFGDLPLSTYCGVDAVAAWRFILYPEGPPWRANLLVVAGHRSADVYWFQGEPTRFTYCEICRHAGDDGVATAEERRGGAPIQLRARVTGEAFLQLMSAIENSGVDRLQDLQVRGFDGFALHVESLVGGSPRRWYFPHPDGFAAHQRVVDVVVDLVGRFFGDEAGGYLKRLEGYLTWRRGSPPPGR